MLSNELTTTSRKRTVLIADDDVIFRTVAAELVRSWGYDCCTAVDGEAALEILKGDPAPTIAVLDWLMPKLTGTEICQHVRSSGSRQYVYFILVSARDGREDSIEGLRSGADTYISKPLDAEELRAKLEIADRIVSMEESLRDSSAEMELFINSVPSILIGTDIRGNITRWNHGATSVFGPHKETILRCPTEKGFSTWWSDSGLQNTVADVIKTGSTIRVNLLFEREASQRLIGLAVYPLRSHVGNVVGSALIGSDVTEKKSWKTSSAKHRSWKPSANSPRALPMSSIPPHNSSATTSFF